MKKWISAALVPLFIVSCNSQTSGQDSQGGGNGQAPSAPGAPSPLDSEELEFVTLINFYREQNGLADLQVSATLTAADLWLAQDMANNNYLDHTDSLGRDFVTRLADFGYSADDMGENVAAGNSTAQATFTQWQQSPPHNANMLGADYRALGVGRAYNASSDYGWYWATDFGSTVDSTLSQVAK